MLPRFKLIGTPVGSPIKAARFLREPYPLPTAAPATACAAILGFFAALLKPKSSLSKTFLFSSIDKVVPPKKVLRLNLTSVILGVPVFDQSTSLI